MKGIIKNILSTKSFGFIRDEQGIEYFFHRDEFEGHWDDLVVDVVNNKSVIKVEFEAKDTPKGKRAINVERLDYPNTAS